MDPSIAINVPVDSKQVDFYVRSHFNDAGRGFVFEKAFIRSWPKLYEPFVKN